MSSTFEDQLREDLHAATSHTAYGSIDPSQVIDEGSRLVQRRRRQRGLGAVAAVAALAVGGFLATDTGRTTTAPPAGPSTTAPATATRSAVFNVTEPTNRRFVVEVAPEASAEANVSYYEVDVMTKQRTLLGRASTTGLGTGATWGRGDREPRVILGVMPLDAFGAMPLLGPEASAGASTEVSPIHGTDYQAFLVQAQDAKTADAFQGLVWSMPGHGIHGPDGLLPTADFLDDKRVSTAKVWVVPSLGTVGLDLLGPVAAAPIAEPGRFTVHTAGRSDDGTSQLSVYGLVQQGSTDLRLTFTDGTQVTREADLEPLGTTGYDAFYAEATGPASARLLEVSWTDLGGVPQKRNVGGG